MEPEFTQAVTRTLEQEGLLESLFGGAAEQVPPIRLTRSKRTRTPDALASVVGITSWPLSSGSDEGSGTREPDAKETSRPPTRFLEELFPAPTGQAALPRAPAFPATVGMEEDGDLGRIAFGGGDMGRYGLRPAQTTGFPESRRQIGRSSYVPTASAYVGLETGYIAASALQALMQLVDESVARHFGVAGNW